MVGVAQLVERRIVIPVVVGSIPIVHPIFYEGALIERSGAFVVSGSRHDFYSSSFVPPLQSSSDAPIKAVRFQPVERPAKHAGRGIPHMIAKEARQALALQRFAEANPQLREEIRELDAREQAQQIEWAFEDAADEQGIQPWELALQLIAETPEQLQAMRLETHREVAEALGMEWEEYCQFNEIEP